MQIHHRALVYEDGLAHVLCPGYQVQDRGSRASTGSIVRRGQWSNVLEGGAVDGEYVTIMRRTTRGGTRRQEGATEVASNLARGLAWSLSTLPIHQGTSRIIQGSGENQMRVNEKEV